MLIVAHMPKSRIVAFRPKSKDGAQARLGGAHANIKSGLHAKSLVVSMPQTTLMVSKPIEVAPWPVFSINICGQQ